MSNCTVCNQCTSAIVLDWEPHHDSIVPFTRSDYDFHCLSALQRRLMISLCIMPWTPCLTLARSMSLLEGSMVQVFVQHIQCHELAQLTFLCM